MDDRPVTRQYAKAVKEAKTIDEDLNASEKESVSEQSKEVIKLEGEKSQAAKAAGKTTCPAVVPPSNMAAYNPKFREFVPEIEEWELFKERLDQYFIVAKVPDSEKSPVLINSLDCNTYRLLRDLCTPKLPAELNYNELCSTMTKYFTPEVVAFKERRKFYSAKRLESESANEWLAKLKNLSLNCKFAERLESVLLDKFLTELHGKAFDRICEEDPNKLTLTKAVDLANKYEVAATEKAECNFSRSQTSKVNNSTKKSLIDVGDNKIRNQYQQPKNKQQLQHDKNKTQQKNCYRCDRPGHSPQQCRFKNYKCKRCKRIGHLAASCKSDSVCNLRETQDDKLEDSVLFNINSTRSKGNPFTLHISIDGKMIEMQLDTGAEYSAVSEEYYRDNFKNIKISKSSINLIGYSGEKLKVIGEFYPILKFNNIEAEIKFVVVGNGGPPILGRNFMEKFNVKLAGIHTMGQVPVENNSVDSRLTTLLSTASSLFDGKLGKYKYKKLSLTLKDNVQPIFLKPRPVPFAYKELVETEIKILENAGIITPIETADWGTPVVPVLKPNGGIRLCGDYKSTINKYLNDFKYPLPRVEEVFQKLNKGVKFSKLDLSRAYNQFELDENSKVLCALSTHKGIYKMNRLPFGVKPASGVVQKEIEKVLAGIPNVINFLDDIVVTGKTDEEHINTLGRVFEALKKAGLKLEREKCEFFKDEIVYIGHKISKYGLKKTEDRMEAIKNAPNPTNLTEVRAFMGLVNYYAKFIPNLSTLMNPIYKLLKKDNKFIWNEECDKSFNQIKSLICKEITLTHFDPQKPIIVMCDASNAGISAVLLLKVDNEEKPVSFVSRTLNKAEANYSVLEKESLAIIFGITKFQQYLLGNTFTLRTDHKPLVSIYGESKGIPTLAASRIQRWAQFLAGFSYKIEYVKSKDNLADCTSRLPVSTIDAKVDKEDQIQFIGKLSEHFITLDKIKCETDKDDQLQSIITALKSGQPIKDRQLEKIRGELYEDQGILMRGHRIVIPRACQQGILIELHKSHLGTVKMKSIARSHFWWLGMDKDITELASKCKECKAYRPSPEKSSLITWEIPEKCWSRIHIDFAGPINGKYFLIIIDALSKWPEVFETKSITTDFTIKALRETFSRFGLPDLIVSDSGTQFTAGKFSEFLKSNGIRHIKTAPGHPASNGAAENFVKTFKRCFKKCLQKGEKDTSHVIATFLLGYRNSVHSSTKKSPSEIMLGRNNKTRLDLVKQALRGAQEKQIGHFKGNRLMKFAVNDKVWIRDYSNNKTCWKQATISQVLGPRNYNCRLDNGRLIKRHVNQIIK